MAKKKKNGKSSARAQPASWYDESVVKKVVIQKIDALLALPQYDGDFLELIQNPPDAAQFFDTLEDKVGERTVTIDLSGLADRFGQSPELMMRYYVKAKKIENQFPGLDFHHFKRPSGSVSQE